MAKIQPLNRENGEVDLYLFWCPGCKENHAYTAGRWQFNGDLERPTFTPSLLYGKDGRHKRCHLFMTDGKIQYLSDCDHELAGKTIDVPDLED
jgi:hypothetical protein